MFHKCFGPEEKLKLPLNKTMCLATNHSWINNDFNFDNTANGFLNMIFLASRMGWLNVIDSASDAVGLVILSYFTKSIVLVPCTQL